MKKIMLVGKTGAGKTSFCQALRGEALHYEKTQDVHILHNTIDTPGEYLENRALYRALLVTSADADLILLLQDCTEKQCMFSPGFGSMFHKPVIGLVTKTDLADQEHCLREAERKLELAGCRRIFHISNTDMVGISDVRTYLGLTVEGFCEEH